MRVGLKLFDKNNKVVVEHDEVPKEVGQAAMVIHQGTHYSYRGLFGSEGRAENPYARFDECAPPYELV